MRHQSICHFLLIILFFSVFHPALSAQAGSEAPVPLPEHPRPGKQRPQWLNLNGSWQFRFDKENEGMDEAWYEAGVEYPGEIKVPFSWGAPLSGVPDEADIGWYAREITAPAGWDGRRIFLVIGAADWHTTAWLDGEKLGEHRGGYTPFEFELTEQIRPGVTHRLVLRIDDTPHDFKLEGKQGYGPARGIWQTPYLEARGAHFIKTLHFLPDIEAELVQVKAAREATGAGAASLQLFIRGDESRTIVTRTFEAGQEELTFEVPLPGPHLWSLDDPFLYEVEATLGEGAAADTLHTYFGMRDISVVDLPGTDNRYVALNGEPVYLQLALDQAYHPEGYYTFPSDEFIRDEVLRSRRIGLNGMRVHVKVGIPRKLYWADRLGMLIMADVPNSWGEPGPEMKREMGYAMRRMIHRDFNHPSIFSWVLFNETWGLYTTVDTVTNERRYLPETQEWVVSMYREAKALDPTRLVEDNSVCCGIGHTETDLNTWHSYLPGWAWEELLAKTEEETYEGSTWNFEEGYRQGRQPNINSEFGNVWGYQGSTGDVDWSWDYHRALNAFRRHPGIAGWLYTEHHDVINEWNGYWRYDRSKKITGMGELVEGMSLRDLHSPIYVSTGQNISLEVRPGEIVNVPVFASFLTGRKDLGDTLRLRADLYGWDMLGQREDYYMSYRKVPYQPWWNGDLAPLRIPMPEKSSVAVLALTVEDAAGNALHRNFTTFIVKGVAPDTIDLAGGRRARLLTVAPKALAKSGWSQKEWRVRDGRKVSGAGAGFFEYRIDWPADLDSNAVESATFLFEASAKQLFGKDREDAEGMGGDYMRGGGTFDPSRNPNAYPMTDETLFPSAVQVEANGYHAGHYELPDDPADHRGILSWHYQLQDRRLREAGSYGYRLSVPLPPEAIREAARSGRLVLRLEVSEALPHGLAIYGAEFGRYPMDPTVVLVLKE
jgi:hypothetical protein